MRIGLDDFREEDYIGDWVLDDTIKIDTEMILSELLVMKYVPEEFNFHIYDAMLRAEQLGLEKDVIEVTIGKFFDVLRLERELDEINKRIYK
jgi:hypothetical protein